MSRSLIRGVGSALGWTLPRSTGRFVSVAAVDARRAASVAAPRRADELRRAQPRARRRLHGSVRLLRIAAARGCLGIGAGLALAIFVPGVFGGSVFTVMSGSMEPVIHVGDVVVAQRIAAVDAHIGDVITFRDPDGTGRMITHRIRTMAVHGGEVHFVTKGDAANGLQRWSMRTDGTLGRVQYRVWKLGYVAVGLHDFFGRFLFLFLVLPALALGRLALVRIWRGEGSAALGSLED